MDTLYFFKRRLYLWTFSNFLSSYILRIFIRQETVEEMQKAQSVKRTENLMEALCYHAQLQRDKK